MNVKYLFDYIEICKSNNMISNWEGFKKYYINNKGVY